MTNEGNFKKVSFFLSIMVSPSDTHGLEAVISSRKTRCQVGTVVPHALCLTAPSPSPYCQLPWVKFYPVLQVQFQHHLLYYTALSPPLELISSYHILMNVYLYTFNAELSKFALFHMFHNESCKLSLPY